MSGRLVHRGPDSDGLFHEGPVALAARRLSIIDLEHGDQPIANEDGSVRRRPERRDLQLPRAAAASWSGSGHRFATDCDTEVLVHLYEEHGEGFVERLRGMFAIALWDARRAAPAAGPRPLRDQAALLPRTPAAASPSPRS